MDLANVSQGILSLAVGLVALLGGRALLDKSGRPLVLQLLDFPWYRRGDAYARFVARWLGIEQRAAHYCHRRLPSCVVPDDEE